MIIPEKAVLRASKWCYQGVWSIFTRWLRVPEEPPQLRGADDADVQTLRPAVGFLNYLKLFFWIGLVLFDGSLFLLWLLLLLAVPWLGLLLAIPIWAIMILPDIVAYIAIHLRYDTTWYVLSDRSMRIRRGIWKIHETTITYDNIQNVSIRQGPIQRFFGISNVLVETAGGGATTSEGQNSTVAGHSGLLEGISNADEVRDLVLAKWQHSRTGGLGDELGTTQTLGGASASGFSSYHVELLEGIHELAIQLNQQ